jgi:uncharacterized protein DUF2484
MNYPLLFAASWVILAAAIGALPHRFVWRGAYFLIALLVPLLPYVWINSGPVVGMFFIAVTAAVLRWPLIYLWKRIARLISGEGT